MKYTKQEIIDSTKGAALIETYVFKGKNNRIHTDNIKYVGPGTFDNLEIKDLPYIDGETDVDIHVMGKEEYETSVLANSSELWPEDLADDDKIAVIIVNGQYGDRPKKMTWDEYNSSEQNTCLDEDNAADQDVVYSNDTYEVRVFKTYSEESGHYFSGEDEDFVIVDSKDGSRESFLIYGCTLEDAINYIEE